jgi:hypothetical protein
MAPISHRAAPLREISDAPGIPREPDIAKIGMLDRWPRVHCGKYAPLFACCDCFRKRAIAMDHAAGIDLSGSQVRGAVFVEVKIGAFPAEELFIGKQSVESRLTMTRAERKSTTASGGELRGASAPGGVRC